MNEVNRSLSFFFFFSFLVTNSSAPCPTTQLACGGVDWNIGSPFFTNTTIPGCPKLHYIQCWYGIPFVQFYNTGFLYVVRNISYFEGTIIVDDVNLNSVTWNPNCTFLYIFKHPIPITNISQLTSYINTTLSSFSCNMIQNEYQQTIFGNFFGLDLSCKNYTLFLPQKPEDRHRSHLPAYCSHGGNHLFNWKLSFDEGDYADTNDDRMSVLSGGFYYDWDLHQDCFSCQVSANSSCTASANGRDPNPPCGCTKQCHVKGGSKKLKKWIIIGVIVAPLIILVLFFFIYLHGGKCCNFVLFSKKMLEDEQKVKALLQNYELEAPKRYNYSEIKKITQGFKNAIGKGGFGIVFKGELSDGREVAVKVLNDSHGNGEDFVNEILSISRTSHVNVVILLGFCFEAGFNRALIYEFMPNGTLADFIYKDKSSMEASILWGRLHDIAVGIARGLEYLHCGCNTHIVHFDIKPHNILLDKEFRPKIGDFGLARLCSTQKSALSMQGKGGTPGYIAPELWFENFGPISSKADVYSFGKIILEMVGERKNFNSIVDTSSECCFSYWVYDHLKKFGSLDAYGVTEEFEEVVKTMILVGLWCIQKTPADRPSMSRVVEMLQGSIDGLQMPPNPKWF